jgi:hypothetical protein
MPEDSRAASRISLHDIVAATAQGALRGIDARKLGADELIRSGFFVDIHITCGGRILQALNPQPLPPLEGPRAP